jgi:hypothetical protein
LSVLEQWLLCWLYASGLASSEKQVAVPASQK